MSVLAFPLPAIRRSPSRGECVAFAILVVWILAMGLSPVLTWLTTWPDAWVLPIASGIDVALGSALEIFRPLARFFAGLLDYPMRWSNLAFTGVHWLLVTGAILAVSWWSGRLPLVVL